MERKQRRDLTREELAEAEALFDEYDRRQAAKQPGAGEPIANPDKYAGPVGADNDGNVETYDRVEDIPD